MSFIESNGVKVRYDAQGSGPAMLLTHGYGVTRRMWESQVAAFKGQNRVIAWDMRGHGDSDSPDNQAEYTEAKYIADMAAILDACNEKRVVIGGLSLGGYLSLAFHYAFPERVRALVLCDTGPGFKDPASRQRWNDRAEATAVKFETQGLAALAEREAKVGTNHRTAVGLIRAARGMFRQHDSRIIESLPSIKVPTLVVIGANDEPLMAGCKYMARKIPNAQFVVVPDSGHYPNVDEPQIFNSALKKFLDGLPAA